MELIFVVVSKTLSLSLPLSLAPEAATFASNCRSTEELNDRKSTGVVVPRFGKLMGASAHGAAG